MSNRQLRIINRYMHIVLAVFIGALVYSPLRTDEPFVLVVQFVVFPLAAVSGLALWQQPRLSKWLRQLRA